MFKKCKVVMLPTNEKAKICLDDKKLTLYQTTLINCTQSWQHLYFLSDEEIKEDDWMYNPDREPSILQCIGKGSVRDWKKIIATTDNSLTEKIEMLGTGSTYVFNLPQPSQSFIEKYVEEYNKGNVITEVMVEYENDKEYWAARNLFNPISIDFKVYTLEEKEKYKGILFDYHPIKLKVNPKDNTITIRKVKDSWNREEIIALLHHFRFCGEDIDKFVEQNL